MKNKNIIIFIISLLTFISCKNSYAEIKWEKDLATAIKKAKSKNLPIMIDIYTDWCSWCKELDKNTYANEKVIETAKKIVSVKLNPETSKEGEEIAKKYGKERRTELISGGEAEVYKEEENIENYPLTLFVTKEGYIKKVSAQSLRSTTAEHKLKEGDSLYQTMESSNVSELLFFSDKATVYKMKTYDLADSKVSAMGEYLPGVLGLDTDEKIIYTVVTTDYAGLMLFAFENGKMAKVELSNYSTKTNRKKLISAYSDKSPIVSVMHISEDCEIAAFADNNKVLALNTEKIPLKTTKSTQGVQVMKLTKKGAKVVKVAQAAECGLEDIKRYQTKNIPAAGSFIKKEDSSQLSLFE